jgi:hypothetical protein
MRYRVLPYRQGSKGAKALADALGGKVLKLEGSKYLPRAGDKTINWGNTSAVEWTGMLNLPSVIRNASNKLLFFRKMKETGLEIVPSYWESPDEIPDSAFPVVCRTVLAGHSGAGIVVAATRSELVPCSLYVQYKKKKDEYRVHVGKKWEDEGLHGHPGAERTVVIATQRKARRNDTPDEAVNWQIRNHDNGFVFVRGGVNPPADVFSSARSALLASGLDFGAVDVIWNDHEGKAYVLEINTAPGLEGQTIEDYANFFKGDG